MGEEKKAGPSMSICVLAVAFCAIFAASGATSNVATTFLQSKWQKAESLCYLCHGSICLFVPYILEYTGVKLGLMLGAFGYIMLCFAPLCSEPVMIGLMCLKGFLSPILWTSFGMFKVMNSTPETQGVNDGAFITIYRLNQVLANVLWMFSDGKIIEGYVLKENAQYNFYLLVQCVAFCLLALVLLGSGAKRDAKKKDPVSFTDMFKTFGDTNILAVYFTYLAVSGFTKAWVLGDFVKFTAPQASRVGLTFGMAALGGGAIGGYCFDKAPDKFRMPVYGLLLDLALLAMATTAAFLRDAGQHDLEMYMYFAIAGVGGITISAMDVTISALVGNKFEKQASCLFAGNQLLYAVGSTIGKGLGGFVPFSALPGYLIAGSNTSTYEICADGDCDVKSQVPLSLFNVGFIASAVMFALFLWAVRPGLPEEKAKKTA